MIRLASLRFTPDDMLKSFSGAILSVSHDRKYIEEVPDKVYELTPDGLRMTAYQGRTD